MIGFVDMFAMKVPLKERAKKFWLSAKDIHHHSLDVITCLHLRLIFYVHIFAKKMPSKERPRKC
jgi:hypothetical protein